MNEKKKDTLVTVDVLSLNVDASEVDKLELRNKLNLMLSDPDSFNKKYVLKPSVTIAITGELSAPERKLFGVLYAHAFDAIESPRHVIALPTLLKALDGTIPNYDRLKEHLLKLLRTTVEWNVLEKDNRIWGAAALLANVTINEDTLLVDYSLAEQLQRPESMMPYAKLDIGLQNRLNSLNSLTLYEVLTDYYSTHLGKGETPWIPIPLFQRILGTNYADWRNIKRKQIDEPLERLKDLDFTIKVELKRRGRKVVAVKFTMKRKSAVIKPKILPRSVKEAWESLSSIERNRIQMEALKRTPINPNEEEMNKAISEIIQERYL
jgi:hypothetical protein